MSSVKGKHALVYGANGALGRAIVEQFKRNSWTVTSLDFTLNPAADHGIKLKTGLSPKDAFASIHDGIFNVLGESRLDAIFNVAGGWQGGNVADDWVFDVLDTMMGQSLGTSVIATKLAALFLKDSGLLVLTGAAAAMGPTPGMIGYGLAKASVHHLIRSVGSDPSASGLPKTAKVVGILPVMLDTPMNRKYMAEGADTSSWTPLERIASELLAWATADHHVKSGKLYKIVTNASITAFEETD